MLLLLFIILLFMIYVGISDVLTTWSIPNPPKQLPKQLQRSDKRSNIRPPTVHSTQPSARPTRVTMKLPNQ